MSTQSSGRKGRRRSTSGRHHHRHDDVESNSPQHHHRQSPRIFESTPPYDRLHSRHQSATSHAPSNEGNRQMSASSVPQHELGRMKSLVRRDRRPIDPNQRDYHYRQHAARMNTQPYADERTPSVESESDFSSIPRSLAREKGGVGTAISRPNSRTGADLETKQQEDRTQRQRERAAVVPLSPWVAYCRVITFWSPDVLLRCFGMPSKSQQQAWREKMGLISIIVSICVAVGYLTFGFTETVCPAKASNRLRVNKVDSGYMIFNGRIYDLSRSKHPYARGIPENANVVYYLGYGGYDGSFLFQNVNGACKSLIKKAPTSAMPSDGDDLAWYFPCVTFKQDGSDQPNFTQPLYTGYRCHTSLSARQTFYGLESYADVYFTWDDVRNKSRNLMVYGSDVLDLNLINWFNKTDVIYPPEFDNLLQNTNLRGKDVTAFFTSTRDRLVAKCLSEIIRVGSVDTATIGCIASRVVLYVSLIFILAIVLVKFFLALAYQWFLAKKYSAPKSPLSEQSKRQRQQQIEEWSDDIYKAPSKVNDQASMPADRSSKRGSVLFPRTSRFTSPYQIDQHYNRIRGSGPTTMASQSASSRMNSGVYKFGNRSDATFDPSSVTQHRSSIMLGADSDGPATGFIHDMVVPQPPAEYQPFGYPLVHAICLVTAYSEGSDGIRSTLDSIAITDYPSSHKFILIICDGIVKGQGEKYSTPKICLSMMKDNLIPVGQVQAFSYVAVASGAKRHNMARIHAGFYNYGEHSRIAPTDQKRVPMMIIEKCGTEDERSSHKPGNRGKRDSQIILMSFLQKVMFDERMTELEYEMFNGMWKVTGISPDFYEVCLMVDADTNVFPDSLTHMVSAVVKDPEIMGLCGETKIANKRASWVSMIQVFEYFISHHLSKSFESVFGGVTCLPGCFCMYRIKAPKGAQNYWVPILANPDIVEHYSENVVDTLHKKNLLLLGEDRYLSTLMLKTFPKRKQMFVPQAVCKTMVPDQFRVLLSQRRRWINSTVHNLMELVLVRDLCGTFCFSMQFVVFIELIGTLVLPAAITFTIYLIVIAIIAAIKHVAAPLIPLVLLALILGLPAVLIVVTAHRWSYVIWMMIYLISLPIWNFVLPSYAYWKFDDFSWGETRKTDGERVQKKGGYEYEGEFDSSKITMKRWHDFERERRTNESSLGWSSQAATSMGNWPAHGYEQ